MTNQFINPKLSKENLESYIIRKEIYKAFSNAIPLFRGEILDAGCGSMPYKELVLANNKITKYVGLDIESSLNYEDVKADILWDGKIMPFKNESFDVVFSTEVLEHVPYPEIYLAEVIRVLKPGGIFFFTVPFLMSLHEVPNDYYRYTPYALEMIFSKAGFVKIQISPMGGYNAALAQMIGLWVKHLLGGRKRKYIKMIAKPLINSLYNNDNPPKDFEKSSMIVGLSGIVEKPKT